MSLPSILMLLFILLLQEGTNLNLYLKTIDRKKRSQPFILLIGGSRLAPHQVFVVVERRGVSVDTLLKATDLTFKITYVLDLGYQPTSYAVWQFLEDVYNLPAEVTGTNAICTSVREFRMYTNNQL